VSEGAGNGREGVGGRCEVRQLRRDVVPTLVPGGHNWPGFPLITALGCLRERSYQHQR